MTWRKVAQLEAKLAVESERRNGSRESAAVEYLTWWVRR